MKELSHETVLGLFAMHLLLRKRKPTSLQEISREGAFRRPEVRGVIDKLRKGGLIRTRSNHGYVLAKAPGEISLLEVVRVLDAPKPPAAPCGGDYDACASRASCLLAPLCRSAEASFEESLRRFTLADLEDTPVDLPNCVDPRVRALDG
jgi:Rrf2 family protein